MNTTKHDRRRSGEPNEPRPKPGLGKGVLERQRGLQKFRGARYHPPDDLSAWVEHFWTTHWDLRGEPPFTQEVLPHPNVHVVMEPGRSEVVGLMTGKFTRLLEGKGRVFSATFLPGGFYRYLGRPLREITDQRIPLEEVFDVDAAALEAEIFGTDDEHAMVHAMAGFLRGLGLTPDPLAAQAASIVRTIVEDTTLTQVSQVSLRVGVGVRTLQRMFMRYVGVSPKWVIRRNRLQEAATRLENDKTLELAGLAADLGYADQAHFIRDFRSLVGVTPAGYAKKT